MQPPHARRVRDPRRLPELARAVLHGEGRERETDVVAIAEQRLDRVRRAQPFDPRGVAAALQDEDAVRVGRVLRHCGQPVLPLLEPFHHQRQHGRLRDIGIGRIGIQLHLGKGGLDLRLPLPLAIDREKVVRHQRPARFQEGRRRGGFASRLVAQESDRAPVAPRRTGVQHEQAAHMQHPAHDGPEQGKSEIVFRDAFERLDVDQRRVLDPDRCRTRPHHFDTLRPFEIEARIMAERRDGLAKVGPHDAQIDLCALVGLRRQLVEANIAANGQSESSISVHGAQLSELARGAAVRGACAMSAHMASIATRQRKKASPRAIPAPFRYRLSRASVSD